jgi:hypothetical protein
MVVAWTDMVFSPENEARVQRARTRAADNDLSNDTAECAADAPANCNKPCSVVHAIGSIPQCSNGVDLAFQPKQLV